LAGGHVRRAKFDHLVDPAALRESAVRVEVLEEVGVDGAVRVGAA
jgi:hypothetical protein